MENIEDTNTDKNINIDENMNASESINTSESININESKKNRYKLICSIPIIFIIVILPLITYGKIVNLPVEEANFWKGGTIHVDFFSYYKSTIFIIISCIFLIGFGSMLLDKQIRLQNYKIYYYPMAIYILFVIISSFLSEYRNVAFLGFIEMYQGMSVLICYILMTFILMNFQTDDKDIKIIIYSFVAISIIIGILGLSQYLGYDFLQTSFGKNLITPKELENANLNFTFGKYTIYATMYNTNFVGSFAAIVLPLTTSLYLFGNNKIKTIIFFLSTLFSFIVWIGCNSRAGYIGIIFSSIIGTIVFKKVIKEKLIKFLILIIGFILIACCLNYISEGRVLSQFSRLSILNEAEKFKKINEEQKVRFKEISVKGNTFTIKTASETLIGFYEDNKFSFKDENNNILKTNKDSDMSITFEDEKYKDYKFINKDDSRILKSSIYERPLDLYAIDDSDEIKIISMNYKLTEPVEAERVKIFDNRETFASNRGYIWSRTIPMIKDTILIGYGPDNYCLVFPQEDYVGRFNTGDGMTNIVIDKPHNMYLQVAINTGMVSLIALLFIWGIYIIESINLYLRGKVESFREYVGAASFLSVLAYLTAGIFNDSVISVAPLFWIILGLGISVNKMIRIDKEVREC